MVLNSTTPGEVLPFVNETASHMWIRTFPPNRKEIISAMNALKLSKAAEVDGFREELFISVPAISADLLLPLVQKSWESGRLPRD